MGRGGKRKKKTDGAQRRKTDGAQRRAKRLATRKATAASRPEAAVFRGVVSDVQSALARWGWPADDDGAKGLVALDESLRSRGWTFDYVADFAMWTRGQGQPMRTIVGVLLDERPALNMEINWPVTDDVDDPLVTKYHSVSEVAEHVGDIETYSAGDELPEWAKSRRSSLHQPGSGRVEEEVDLRSTLTIRGLMEGATAEAMVALDDLLRGRGWTYSGTARGGAAFWFSPDEDGVSLELTLLDELRDEMELYWPTSDYQSTVTVGEVAEHVEELERFRDGDELPEWGTPR